MRDIRFQNHWVFLIWLITTGLSLFAIIVCWNEGYIGLLYEADKSRICTVIGALYLLGSAHCGARALFLSKEAEDVQKIQRTVGDTLSDVKEMSNSRITVEQFEVPRGSILEEYIRGLIRLTKKIKSESETDKSSLMEIVVARAKGTHDVGWFAVDVLLKLGLLGTIVGFILMLGSVTETVSFDVNTMQEVLRQMSNGMGTALYTTMVGLIGSVSLGLQYLLLDKGADDLIERVLKLCDSHIRNV